MVQQRSSGTVRLVVETDDPALRISDFASFRAAGFDVVVCGGPDRSHGCPAIDGEICGEMEWADVVYNAFRDLDTQLEVANAVHRTADTSMLVSVTPGMTDQL